MTAHTPSDAFTVARPAVVERFLIDGTRPSWDRGDGYDARNPDAPLIFCCDGCDAYRETEKAYCPSCAEVTGSYIGTGERWSMVMRYDRDPVYAAQVEAQREEKRAECHRYFDIARDAGLRRAGLL